MTEHQWRRPESFFLRLHDFFKKKHKNSEIYNLLLIK